MTINYARESVIDFTKPFMNLGISIMFKVCPFDQFQLFIFSFFLAQQMIERGWFHFWNFKRSILAVKLRACTAPYRYPRRIMIDFLYPLLLIGSNQAASASFLVHEAVDVGHLALRFSSLCFGFHHHVPSQSILTLRMAQSVSVRRRSHCHPQSIQSGQQLLVHCRHVSTLGCFA